MRLETLEPSPGSPRALCLALIAVAAVSPPARADVDPFEEDRAVAEKPQLLWIRVEGNLDMAAVDRVRAEKERWLVQGHRFQYAVLEIDSRGTDPEAATALHRFIVDDLRSLTTIAFVPPGKEALGGAALSALSANELFMGAGSRIGPVSGADLSALREAFRSAAAREGRPTLLAEAMAGAAPDDIFAVRFSVPGGQAEKTEFLKEKDVENLPPARRMARRGEPRRVLAKGEVRVLDASDAREYGLASGSAQSRADLLESAKILIPEQNIVDGTYGAVRSRGGKGQGLIDFFNKPVPRFLLLLCGSLALLLEFKLLGTMIPGTIALVCFGIFFGTSMLPVTGSQEGTANLFELTLFVLGLGFLAMELFLLPGTALFAVSGGALCAVSIVMAMMSPENSAGSLSLEAAVGILLYGLAAGVLTFLGILRWIPTRGVFARRGLVSHGALAGVPTADSALEAQSEAQAVLGKIGKTVTSLRPAGKVILENGRLLDVVAEGEFVEAGVAVKVILIEGPRIVVAQEHDGSDAGRG